MSFENQWKRRRSIEPEIDEPVEDERREFYTFLVPVEGDVGARLLEVQEELAGFECFKPVPEHWFHVTVKLAGFRVDDAEKDDEFDDLARVKEKAGEAVEGFESFKAEVKNLNVFPAAVFAEVHSRELEELNQAFRSQGFMPPEHDYIPHVTLGHFRSRKDFSSMVDALEKFRGESFGGLKVDEVLLVKDDLNEPRSKGFDVVERFRL